MITKKLLKLISMGLALVFSFHQVDASEAQPRVTQAFREVQSKINEDLNHLRDLMKDKPSIAELATHDEQSKVVKYIDSLIAGYKIEDPVVVLYLWSLIPADSKFGALKNRLAAMLKEPTKGVKVMNADGSTTKASFNPVEIQTTIEKSQKALGREIDATDAIENMFKLEQAAIQEIIDPVRGQDATRTVVQNYMTDEGLNTESMAPTEALQIVSADAQTQNTILSMLKPATIVRQAMMKPVDELVEQISAQNQPQRGGGNGGQQQGGGNNNQQQLSPIKQQIKQQIQAVITAFKNAPANTIEKQGKNIVTIFTTMMQFDDPTQQAKQEAQGLYNYLIDPKNADEGNQPVVDALAKIIGVIEVPNLKNTRIAWEQDNRSNNNNQQQISAIKTQIQKVIDALVTAPAGKVPMTQGGMVSLALFKALQTMDQGPNFINGAKQAAREWYEFFIKPEKADAANQAAVKALADLAGINPVANLKSIADAYRQEQQQQQQKDITALRDDFIKYVDSGSVNTLLQITNDFPLYGLEEFSNVLGKLKNNNVGQLLAALDDIKGIYGTYFGEYYGEKTEFKKNVGKAANKEALDGLKAKYEQNVIKPLKAAIESYKKLLAENGQVKSNPLKFALLYQLIKMEVPKLSPARQLLAYALEALDALLAIKTNDVTDEQKTSLTAQQTLITLVASQDQRSDDQIMTTLAQFYKDAILKLDLGKRNIKNAAALFTAPYQEYMRAQVGTTIGLVVDIALIDQVNAVAEKYTKKELPKKDLTAEVLKTQIQSLRQYSQYKQGENELKQVSLAVFGYGGMLYTAEALTKQLTDAGDDIAKLRRVVTAFATQISSIVTYLTSSDGFYNGVMTELKIIQEVQKDNEFTEYEKYLKLMKDTVQFVEGAVRALIQVAESGALDKFDHDQIVKDLTAQNEHIKEFQEYAFKQSISEQAAPQRQQRQQQQQPTNVNVTAFDKVVTDLQATAFYKNLPQANTPAAITTAIGMKHGTDVEAFDRAIAFITALNTTADSAITAMTTVMTQAKTLVAKTANDITVEDSTKILEAKTAMNSFEGPMSAFINTVRGQLQSMLNIVTQNEAQKNKVTALQEACTALDQKCVAIQETDNQNFLIVMRYQLPDDQARKLREQISEMADAASAKYRAVFGNGPNGGSIADNPELIDKTLNQLVVLSQELLVDESFDKEVAQYAGGFVTKALGVVGLWRKISNSRTLEDATRFQTEFNTEFEALSTVKNKLQQLVDKCPLIAAEQAKYKWLLNMVKPPISLDKAQALLNANIPQANRISTEYKKVLAPNDAQDPNGARMIFSQRELIEKTIKKLNDGEAKTAAEQLQAKADEVVNQYFAAKYASTTQEATEIAGKCLEQNGLLAQLNNAVETFRNKAKADAQLKVNANGNFTILLHMVTPAITFAQGQNPQEAPQQELAAAKRQVIVEIIGLYRNKFLGATQVPGATQAAAPNFVTTLSTNDESKQVEARGLVEGLNDQILTTAFNTLIENLDKVVTGYTGENKMKSLTTVAAVNALPEQFKQNLLPQLRAARDAFVDALLKNETALKGAGTQYKLVFDSVMVSTQQAQQALETIQNTQALAQAKETAKKAIQDSVDALLGKNAKGVYFIYDKDVINLKKKFSPDLLGKYDTLNKLLPASLIRSAHSTIDDATTVEAVNAAKKAFDENALAKITNAVNQFKPLLLADQSLLAAALKKEKGAETLFASVKINEPQILSAYKMVMNAGVQKYVTDNFVLEANGDYAYKLPVIKNVIDTDFANTNVKTTYDVIAGIDVKALVASLTTDNNNAQQFAAIKDSTEISKSVEPKLKAFRDALLESEKAVKNATTTYKNIFESVKITANQIQQAQARFADEAQLQGQRAQYQTVLLDGMKNLLEYKDNVKVELGNFTIVSADNTELLGRLNLEGLQNAVLQRVNDCLNRYKAIGTMDKNNLAKTGDQSVATVTEGLIKGLKVTVDTLKQALFDKIAFLNGLNGADKTKYEALARALKITDAEITQANEVAQKRETQRSQLKTQMANLLASSVVGQKEVWSITLQPNAGAATALDLKQQYKGVDEAINACMELDRKFAIEPANRLDALIASVAPAVAELNTKVSEFKTALLTKKTDWNTYKDLFESLKMTQEEVEALALPQARTAAITAMTTEVTTLLSSPNALIEQSVADVMARSELQGTALKTAYDALRAFDITEKMRASTQAITQAKTLTAVDTVKKAFVNELTGLVNNFKDALSESTTAIQDPQTYKVLYNMVKMPVPASLLAQMTELVNQIYNKGHVGTTIVDDSERIAQLKKDINRMIPATQLTFNNKLVDSLNGKELTTKTQFEGEVKSNSVKDLEKTLLNCITQATYIANYVGGSKAKYDRNVLVPTMQRIITLVDGNDVTVNYSELQKDYSFCKETLNRIAATVISVLNTQSISQQKWAGMISRSQFYIDVNALQEDLKYINSEAVAKTLSDKIAKGITDEESAQQRQREEAAKAAAIKVVLDKVVPIIEKNKLLDQNQLTVIRNNMNNPEKYLIAVNSIKTIVSQQTGLLATALREYNKPDKNYAQLAADITEKASFVKTIATELNTIGGTYTDDQLRQLNHQLDEMVDRVKNAQALMNAQQAVKDANTQLKTLLGEKVNETRAIADSEVNITAAIGKVTDNAQKDALTQAYTLVKAQLKTVEENLEKLEKAHTEANYDDDTFNDQKRELNESFAVLDQRVKAFNKLVDDNEQIQDNLADFKVLYDAANRSQAFIDAQAAAQERQRLAQEQERQRLAQEQERQRLEQEALAKQQLAAAKETALKNMNKELERFLISEKVTVNKKTSDQFVLLGEAFKTLMNSKLKTTNPDLYAAYEKLVNDVETTFANDYKAQVEQATAVAAINRLATQFTDIFMPQFKTDAQAYVNALAASGLKQTGGMLNRATENAILFNVVNTGELNAAGLVANPDQEFDTLATKTDELLTVLGSIKANFAQGKPYDVNVPGDLTQKVQDNIRAFYPFVTSEAQYDQLPKGQIFTKNLFGWKINALVSAVKIDNQIQSALQATRKESNLEAELKEQLERVTQCVFALVLYPGNDTNFISEQKAANSNSKAQFVAIAQKVNEMTQLVCDSASSIRVCVDRKTWETSNEQNKKLLRGADINSTVIEPLIEYLKDQKKFIQELKNK